MKGFPKLAIPFLLFGLYVFVETGNALAGGFFVLIAYLTACRPKGAY